MQSEMKIGPQQPSNLGIYIATGASLLLSLLLLRKNPTLATFVGLWPPTILGMGAFFKENKLIEMQQAH